MYSYHAYTARTEDIKIYLFGAFLMALFIGGLAVALLSSGPIVLGSEMNTNGKVEYLCLGTGCEDARYL